jgi:hypothetical protein
MTPEEFRATWAHLRETMSDLRDTDWSFVADLEPEDVQELVDLNTELMVQVMRLKTNIEDYLAVVAEMEET